MVYLSIIFLLIFLLVRKNYYFKQIETEIKLYLQTELVDINSINLYELKNILEEINNQLSKKPMRGVLNIKEPIGEKQKEAYKLYDVKLVHGKLIARIKPYGFYSNLINNLINYKYHGHTHYEFRLNFYKTESYLVKDGVKFRRGNISTYKASISKSDLLDKKDVISKSSFIFNTVCHLSSCEEDA